MGRTVKKRTDAVKSMALYAWTWAAFFIVERSSDYNASYDVVYNRAIKTINGGDTEDYASLRSAADALEEANAAITLTAFSKSMATPFFSANTTNALAASVNVIDSLMPYSSICAELLSTSILFLRVYSVLSNSFSNKDSITSTSTYSAFSKSSFILRLATKNRRKERKKQWNTSNSKK